MQRKQAKTRAAASFAVFLPRYGIARGNQTQKNESRSPKQPIFDKNGICCAPVYVIIYIYCRFFTTGGRSETIYFMPYKGE
jgi:hypothetical protein